MFKPDPRRAAYRPDIADLRLKGRVEAKRFVAGQVMRAAEPVVNLFSGPERTGIGTQLLFGEAIRVFDTDLATGLAWGQAEADGYVGYAPLGALRQGMAGTHQVTALSAPIYPAPNFKAPIRFTVPMLSRVDAGDPEDGFHPIPGGYIHARHFAPIACDMVSYAEQYIGTPYLWGGMTALGIDCSGLVQIAARAAGHDAPRDADMQETELGTPIPREIGLGRGDLVFWKGHVGLMVDDATLLHANIHHMAVVAEPLTTAETRIAATDTGPITSIRRM